MSDTDEFPLNAALNTTLGEDGKLEGYFTYTRKLNFSSSVSTLVRYKDEVKTVELSVGDDDEGDPRLTILMSGVDADGEEWEEEEDVVPFFDSWDAQVAFKLFSDFLPAHFPNVEWTFSDNYDSE